MKRSLSKKVQDSIVESTKQIHVPSLYLQEGKHSYIESLVPGKQLL